MSQFGQPPLAALLPLKAGQNLSDVPDKAAALANLGTLSSSDILLNSVPIGTIISFWGSVAPAGYLPCSGQTINSGTFPDLVTFLGGGSSQVVPDLRGEFLRGWDNGRGVDTSRAANTSQGDAMRNITGYQGAMYRRAESTAPTGPFSTSVVSSGIPASSTASAGLTLDVYFNLTGVVPTAAEFRPRNVSVLYCIKAYGSLANTTTANIGNVLTELSQTAKITQFENSIITNGYQKISGGLILQWGYTSALTANAVSVVSFPVAFPNACLNVVSTPQYAAATSDGSTFVPVISSFTNSTVSIILENGVATSASNVRAYFIAIGY